MEREPICLVISDSALRDLKQIARKEGTSIENAMSKVIFYYLQYLNNKD